MPATSSLHHAARIDQTRRRLGKLGRLDGGPAAGDGPALRLVTPAAPPRDLAFPLGAQTRKVDASGRLKFTGDTAPTRVLGWEPGGLRVTIVEGWLVLDQPAGHAGTSPGRYSSVAGFTATAKGVERVLLKPAHLDTVGLPVDRHLLVAPVPGTGALVVVNPVACLAGAPTAVAAALGTVPAVPDPA